MSDTPGPWRSIDGNHFQRCGTYGAMVWRKAPRVYGWQVYMAVHPPLEHSTAPTLAAAKRAATAALIRHAPMPF